MSQNKVRKHLRNLSTRTKREQKFVKDETENRRLPILKINLLHGTVCEVDRTDYLNRKIASKNKDNEDKNISSESIFHKFPENISDKVCLTKKVVLKSLVENIDVHKKRQRENLKGDFSESKKKRSISDGKSQESHNDIVDSSKKIEPFSVKVNDNAKEMCDKYMENYIKYKTEKYRDEEYSDEELVLFPHLSDIEMYLKQELPDIGTLCPIDIDSCLQMGVSRQEVTISELEANLSNDVLLSTCSVFLKHLSSDKTLPLEFEKFLFSDPVFKENNHSSSMAVKESAFHVPVVEIHRNTVNTINNKSVNVVKGESIIQSGKQLVNTSKPVVLNICTYDKTPAKNKQGTYIFNSAVHAQTNKKPAVNTNNSDVNGQATYKRSMNRRKRNVNGQINIKQRVSKATCNVKKQLKKGSFDVQAFLSLQKLDLNFKIPKKHATPNVKSMS
ncbi:hypothetical protein CDAR_488671 [Caerostris darwini]|uniref:Uncharacterized protein n=1 Tax=Caerostris darwini TaxID=1538125 RepID=A0AAV4SAC9_9ARAC|nr:hypothetical protein CDAR_488671 [Caerostris darwini]